MKVGLKTTIRLLVIALLLGSCLPAFTDEVTVNFVPQVLQSFDPEEETRDNYRTWALFPSKFGYDADGNSLWEEQLEQLEQLRVLENGYRIRVVVTNYDSVGVDVPADVERVERLLAES